MILICLQLMTATVTRMATTTTSSYAPPPQAMIITLQAPVHSLAERVREQFHTHRSYFLDIVKLDERVPDGCLTLKQWSQPDAFATLSDRYADANYAQHPDVPRDNKPLHSLWAQWYFGLIVPPLMMALVLEDEAICCDPAHFHVEFHESGRPARFWVTAENDAEARHLSIERRLERLVTTHLMPVTAAIAAQHGVSAKLVWNNNGYLMHWFLQELAPFIDPHTKAALEHRLFFSRTLSDGQDNPLYRTMIPRDGELIRRTCCQRYKLPSVNKCSDCTLNLSE